MYNNSLITGINNSINHEFKQGKDKEVQAKVKRR